MQLSFLHVHSYYSLLEGLCSPSRLAKLTRQYGMPALALTDSLNLSGAVEFSQACKKEGIQAILGLQVNLAMDIRATSTSTRRSGPITLLCMNAAGWANLCRLISILLDSPENDSQTKCSLEILAQHSVGLICLTGGRTSLLNQLLTASKNDSAQELLERLQGIFADQLYVELSPEDKPIRDLLIGIAERLSLPVVATPEVYYETAEQVDLESTLIAIRQNVPLSQLAQDARRPGAHFPAPDEISANFESTPQALTNITEITARCQYQLPLGEAHFPEIYLPPGVSADKLLRQKAFEGAQKIYGSINEEITLRLEQELGVIEKLHFEPVFLIMEEILHFARQAGIPYSSRGSAASSLVAHCLGITRPDPLKLNLYFERFLNPHRTNPPDIDTDLCSRRRDLVLQHVFDTYGADRVAMVCTINRYRTRSALSDVAKAHGLTPTEVKQLTARLPYRFYYAQSEDEEGNDISPSAYRDLARQYPSPKYQLIFQQAEALLGMPRYLSVHPGGIVITPGLVTELLPVQRSQKGMRITQFDHSVLEPLGIIKLDLLGIRGLTVLGDVADSIYSWRRNEFAAPLAVLDAVPADDPITANAIRTGQTIGCFQIESPGMRATLKEIHAHRIEDILVALALYRPGPLTGGLKDAFVRRHNGLETVTHIHPALAPLLEDTYGVILYQEQVLRIAHGLAGLSLAESDLLRRAMSHFDPGKQMQTLKNRFIRGALEKNGVDAESAERIWELMAAFAGYGFPKAHAASYALIAWQSAWCKTHFPAEFMAAVLANWGGYYGQRVYLMEARRMHLPIRPPHINHSRREFCVTYPEGDPVLYMGLDQVRDLTHKTQTRITTLRPFSSLEDFRNRVNPRREELTNLIRCGALDGMGAIPWLLANCDNTHSPVGQLMLFEEPSRVQNQPDWTQVDRMNAQIEVLGISVETHPLELFAQQIRAADAVSTVEAISRVGMRVRIAGIRQSSHRSRTAGGEMMLFLSLEDLEGMMDVIIFPQIYHRYRTELAGNQPVLIEGIIESDLDRSSITMRAERIFRLG